MTLETGKPRVLQALDSWVVELYEKYKLGNEPSLDKVQQVAIRLLSKPQTFISGAELILGRRVDASYRMEAEILGIIGHRMDAEGRFELLLLQREIEDERVRNGLDRRGL